VAVTPPESPCIAGRIFKASSENLKEKDLLEDEGINGRIIL
jgi:hypothetical protein